MNRRRKSPRAGGTATARLTPLWPESGTAVEDGVVVDVEESVGLYDEFLMGPEPVLRTSPRVDSGEAPREAASFNAILETPHMLIARHRAIVGATSGIPLLSGGLLCISSFPENNTTSHSKWHQRGRRRCTSGS